MTTARDRVHTGQKPIRLIYVTVSMPFGPGESFLIPEAHELIRQGLQLLIVPRSPMGEVFNQDSAGLEQYCVRQPLLSLSVLLCAGLEYLRHPLIATRSLGMVLRTRRIFVILKNMTVFPKALWLARRAREWQADHIHAHWGLTTATMAMVASELTNTPWSMTLHRGDIAEPNLLATKIERAAFSRFISQSGLCIAGSRGQSALDKNTCVIHMGVPVPEPPSRLGIGESPFTILCPANLIPVKGHAYLIQALGILRDRGVPCFLRIAGEGELLEPLRHQVDELDLEAAVTFTGRVPHEKLISWYEDHEIDVVVLPSVDLGNHLNEGIPVALLEAMAYGIPVVSTDTGGIPELVGGGAGIVVPPQEPDALADALEDLSRDTALRHRLGHAGRRRVTEQFSVECTTGDLIERIKMASAPQG